MSTDIAWTPGPWRTEARGGNYPISVVDCVNGEIIAPFCGGERAEKTANAILIAAAPDLYEALENLLLGCHSEVDEPRDEVSAAFKALAKAKGEQS